MSYERGSVIAGKYRVERVIGQGGMGVVLAARHLGLDEMVAVKVIRAERAEATDALIRFQREARAVARIKSEHVARVLDVDRMPTGAPYIVMELIEGTDLHALLAKRHKLPISEAASYIVQACEGLAEAHALGMVHRDLKLKNLFLTKRRDGRALIKVIDFGVVKLSTLTATDDATPASGSALERMPACDATLTGKSTFVGSLHYMAPEQIRASNVVTAQADIWSLGVCLYTMLTGSLPFDGATVGELSSAIQGRPAPDVRSLEPDVPATMATAIARMLERDIRRRFANVFELASAIAPHGLDEAAPKRIGTILASGDAVASHEDPTQAESTSSRDLRSSHATERTETAVTNVPIGRADSTLGTAAVSSARTLKLAPASRTARWGLVAAAGTAVLVAGALVKTGLPVMSSPHAASAPSAAAALAPSAAAPSTPSAAAASTPSAAAASTPSAAAASTPSAAAAFAPSAAAAFAPSAAAAFAPSAAAALAPSAAAALAPSAAAAVSTSTAAASSPAPAAVPTAKAGARRVPPAPTPPKVAPSSAYDRF